MPERQLVATIAAALHGDLMFSECVYCVNRNIPAAQCDLWYAHTRQATTVVAALDDYYLAPADSDPEPDR